LKKYLHDAHPLAVPPEKSSEIMFYPVWISAAIMLFPRWIILGFAALTGCGTAPPPASPVKLTILGLTLEAGDQLKQDILNEYTQKTAVAVELVPTLGNSAEQLRFIRKLLHDGAPRPDIFLIDLIWPSTLEEHLLDLMPHLNGEWRSHLPPVLNSGIVGDRVVGLPFYMSAGVLYYRADLLKKYGFSAPPRTWDELHHVALSIQRQERKEGRKSFWGFVWQGAAYEGLTCNALEWQASFGGGRLIENDGSITVNNQQTLQAMKTAAGWVGSISPPSVTAYTETDSQNVFRSGNAAFMRYWTSGFRATATAMPPGSAAMAPLPAGPRGRAQTVGGFHLAVSRYSRHPREAVALVQHLTSAAVQMRRALSRGFLPTYAHIYQRPEFQKDFPEIDPVLEVLPNTMVLRPALAAGEKYAEVSRAYYTTVNDILTRKIRADAALPVLQSTLQSVLANPGTPPK
jgi:trehalose/maltose transport system substrate-binding protein